MKLLKREFSSNEQERKFSLSAALISLGIALGLIVAMVILSEVESFVGIGRQVFYLVGLALTVGCQTVGFLLLDGYFRLGKSEAKETDENTH